MKELTIEEKATRYDEASKWMEGIYPTLTHEQQGEAEAFFPELKESEDEKIKRILHSISSKMSYHLRDIFTDEEFQCFDAWLKSLKDRVGCEVNCTTTKEWKSLSKDVELTWEDIKIILDIETDILRDCNNQKEFILKTYPKGEDYYGEILKRFEDWRN